MKMKKCKNCKQPFEPKKPLQYLCSPYCAILYANKKAEERQKKEDRELKEELRTKSYYIKILQQVFNKYIRERDKHLPCISCGRSDVEEFHAGHYIPTTYQYHRFSEDNVHKQCSYCNTHLRGNIIEYRKNLINKIGLANVEYLENTKNMIFEMDKIMLKDLIAEYKKKIKNIL